MPSTSTKSNAQRNRAGQRIPPDLFEEALISRLLRLPPADIVAFEVRFDELQAAGRPRRTFTVHTSIVLTDTAGLALNRLAPARGP